MEKDFGRERRVRELSEEISRLKLEDEARRKRRRRTKQTKFDALIEELGKIPGCMWDERDRDQFMTCQGFAPRDIGGMTPEEVIKLREKIRF